MTTSLTSSRPFRVGTTGWSAKDLDDPTIERRWEQGAYEIVEGVLTKMPPAYYDASKVVDNLLDLLRRHLRRRRVPGSFGHETDLILGPQRIVRVDAVFMTPADEARQRRANAPHRRGRIVYGRLRVAPTLIIESVSIGHEDHDQQTKRRWYAEADVPNYWLLNAYEKTLECLVLRQGAYQVDQTGRGEEEIRPSLFPGLILPLKRLWAI